MSSFYMAINLSETDSLDRDGMVSAKAGVCMGRQNLQNYVNRRYMSGELLGGRYMPGVDFETIKDIERRVLSDLQNVYGYRRQHGKKEHFIIADNTEEKQKFAEIVQRLYSRYCP